MMKRDLNGNAIVQACTTSHPRESFFLSCPNEVLFQVCWYLDDVNDLLSLSLTSKCVRERLAKFIQVCGPLFEGFGRHSGVEVTRGFKFCDRVAPCESIPDWSVTLLSLRDCEKVTSFLEGTVYIGQLMRARNRKNFKVFIEVLPSKETRSFGVGKKKSQLTDFLLQSYALMDCFLLGLNYVLTLPDSHLELSHHPSLNTTIKAPNMKDFRLEHVNYTLKFPFQNVSPHKLTLSYCSSKLLPNLPLHNLKELNIRCLTLPIIQDLGPSPKQIQTVPLSLQLSGLKNISFPQLEFFAAQGVNYLINIDFPKLKDFAMEMFADPRTHYAQPVMKQVNFPHFIHHFSLATNGNSISFEDCGVFPATCGCSFSLCAFEMPCHTGNLEVQKVCVPRGKSVHLMNTLHQIDQRSIKEVTSFDARVWNDIQLLSGSKCLEFDSLTRATIKHHKTLGNLTQETAVDGRLTFLAPRLQDLKFEKHRRSSLVLDFKELSEKHPLLRSLTCVRRESVDHADVYTEGTQFAHLEKLILRGFPLVECVRLIESLIADKSQSLKTLILDVCHLNPQNAELDIKTIIDLIQNRLSSSLKTFTLSLDPNTQPLAFHSPLKVQALEELQDLDIHVDAREIEITGCPRLVSLHLDSFHRGLTKLTLDSAVNLRSLHYAIEGPPGEDLGNDEIAVYADALIPDIERVLVGVVPDRCARVTRVLPGVR